ncbi:MAG: hypothetical protein FWC87_04730 [Acidimicrobiaceae bacterium]|nr:hypothetical protein [Acidimicrobiaceae bacterium]
MSAAKGAVEVADRRGNDAHLRVSWHPEKRLVNISHWRRGICVSSTPVELTDVPALVNLLVRALEEAARTPAGAEEPPGSGSDTATGARPAGVGSVGTGRRWLRWARGRIATPDLAPIIEMKSPPESPHS